MYAKSLLLILLSIIFNNKWMQFWQTQNAYALKSSSDFEVVQKVSSGCAVFDTYGPIHVDLSSACIRCSMCLAIADEINQTLLEIHNTMALDDWLNDTEAVFLLRTICDHSFRHYNLREIDGRRFISGPLSGDRLIISSIDGSWEKNLRNMCNEYLNEIQELQLYRNWMEWYEDDNHVSNLKDILCRLISRILKSNLRKMWQNSYIS